MKQFSRIKLFRSAAAMVLALVLTVPAGAANQDSPVQSALSAYTTVTGELPLDAATFPDAAFLGYVKTLDLDANGSLSAEERAQVVRMDVRNRGIASLQGLEQFPNLEYLNCNNNALTELDLALAPRLQTLFCNDNQLTVLDVSAAASLQILLCHANQLTALDVSGNPELSDLACGDNPIQELDLKANRKLEYFTYLGGPLTRLELGNNESMIYLWVGYTPMTEIDMSGLPNLQTVGLDHNEFTFLDLSGNPQVIDLLARENRLLGIEMGTAAPTADLSDQRPVAIHLPARLREEPFVRAAQRLPPPPLPRICPLHRLRQFPRQNRRRPRPLCPSRNRKSRKRAGPGGCCWFF